MNYSKQVIVITNKNFQRYSKELLCVRLDFFSFANHVAIKTWMGNTPFDQISA